MTSPCRTPAAAPGPFASTLIAIAPTPPASSLTGCRLKAKISARDPALRRQEFGDAVDRRQGNDERAPPWAKYGHAEGLAFGVESEPAFARPRERRVEFDARVDDAAPQAAPLRADERHDAERCGRRAVARAGDDRKGAGRRRFSRYGRFRQIGPRDAQDGDVG